MKKTLLAAALLLGALTVSAQDYKHSIGATVGSMYGVSYKGFIFGVEGLALQADLGVKLGNYGKTYTLHYKGDYTVDGTSAPGYPVSATYTGKRAWSQDYFTFELNPNVVYQKPIAELSFGKLSWYAGAGISIGMLKSATHGDYYDSKGNKHNSWWAMSQTVDTYNSITGDKETKALIPAEFKFGFNAIGGVELKLNSAPIVIGFDFRPGYGLSYYNDTEKGTVAGKEYKDISKYTTSFFDWTLAASVRYCL